MRPTWKPCARRPMGYLAISDQNRTRTSNERNNVNSVNEIRSFEDTWMSAQHGALTLHLDPQAFAPIIRVVVAEVLAQLEADRQQLPENGRLAYSEEEAARMLGLEPHQLRDERRRGRIAASSIVGRRVRYTRNDLLGYLQERRIPAKENG